ncbi:MAG: hypothetical protein ACHQ51_14155 [Elusimicrobiota bacterium]
METIPCPGCRTLLGPEITACPICTRPRSKYEITRAYATLRAMQERRRRRPFIVAAWLIGLGAAAGVAHQFRSPLLTAAAAGRARVVRFVDEARDPSRFSTQPPDAPAAPGEPSRSTGPSSPPPIDSPAKSSWIPWTPSPGAPSKTGQSASATPRPEPPRKRPTGDLPLPRLNPGNWALRGTVYDILTLRPVPQTAFLVRSSDAKPNDGGEPFSTDQDGRYIVTLARVSSGGYEILADAPAYAPATFYESDIPYAQLSEAERRDMAESAATGDVHPTPITDIIGEEAIHRDLFVVPRR